LAASYLPLGAIPRCRIWRSWHVFVGWNHFGSCGI